MARIVRCTIEMELVEGRDFKMRGRKKKDFVLQKAEFEFEKLVKQAIEDGDLFSYIQTKIVEEQS